MFNDRPIDCEKTRDALIMIDMILEKYDLAGCVQVINEEEWAYTYRLVGSWNAIYEDDRMPMGMRFKGSTEIPEDEKKIENTAHLFASMKDFAAQTIQHAQDFLLILKEAGIDVHHTPFGGAAPPPQIKSVPSAAFYQGEPPMTRAERRRKKFGKE